MAISFNQVPAGQKVPFLYAEFDNSQAVQGAGVQPVRAALIGQKLAAGTAVANTKILITSYAQAVTLFGAGSMLALMVKAYRDNNNVNEMYAIPLADAGSSVAATGSVTFSGSVTKAGVLNFYIAKQKASIAVAVGDTLSDIVIAMAAAINATGNSFPLSAAQNNPTNEQLDLTAKNKGTVGNSIDLRFNYTTGDALPAGLSVSITDMADGAGDPDIQDAIDVLGDDQTLLIGGAYSDASNLTAMETELLNRFGPMLQNDGYYITAARGTVSDLNTLGNSRNSQFTAIRAHVGPSSPYERVAATIGVVAAAAQIDPARPFQTLQLVGIGAETDDESFSMEERNILLNNGIGTDKKSAGDIIRIERVITTYKENPAGADDISYYDLNTLLTLSYLRYDFRNFWLSKYPRHKLANDGTQFAAGQAVMTPKVAKAEAVNRFRLWENNGLVENIDSFKENLIVERNNQDPNRLDFLLPPDVINQLRVVGVKISFFL